MVWSRPRPEVRSKGQSKNSSFETTDIKGLTSLVRNTTTTVNDNNYNDIHIFIAPGGCNFGGSGFNLGQFSGRLGITAVTLVK